MAEDQEPTEGGSPTPNAQPTVEYVSRAELERQIRELREERRQLQNQLEELHASDKAERESMRQEITAISQFIATLEEAERQKDAVKGSKTTIVLPPNDIPPQQPNPGPQSGGTEQSGEEPKRKLRFW